MRTDTPVPIKLEDYAPYPFQIQQVHLVFRLGAAETEVDSRMLVERTGPGDLVLNGVGLDLRSVVLDGRTLSGDDYTLTDESLTVHDVPDRFELSISVTNHPDRNTALSGLYVSGGRLCTQCEADGFRRITYWPDRPDVMSRFHVRVEGVKAEYPYLLSNGTPGAAGDLAGGRHFVEWDDPHPKPSYLFALCAGDYDVFTDTFTTMNGREVDLAIHVDKGDAERAAYAMDSLKRSMAWDEAVFGREYDLGVFNIVAVRDFNFGAMENKGLNVFNSAYVLADEATATDFDFEAIESIVAHEYFHNWTGNRITCRDWFQLCLKEGLTVFRDQEFSADMRARPVQRIKDVIRLRTRQFAEDGGPLAHAVRPKSYASVDNLYTATVYEKGSELIRMLKTLIGDEAFASGMDLYFERFDGQAATIEDFYSCFAEASGQDLSHFMVWYSQPGTPTVTVTHIFDAESGDGVISLQQSNPATSIVKAPQPLPIPLRWALLDGEGGHVESDQGSGEQTFILDTASAEIRYKTAPRGTRPLLSLNRGFSAPVHVKDDLSLAEQHALVRSETNPFNQWDRLQSLVKRDLLAMAYGDANGPDAELIDTLAMAVMRAAPADPAFAALLTGVPSVAELFQAHAPVHPARLSRARSHLRGALLDHPGLADLAQTVLAAPSPTPFKPDAAQAGGRALRGAMISLMGARGNAADRETLAQLYDSAPNMTEQLACLRAVGEAEGLEAKPFADFYAQWKDQPLVVDKWFQVGAMAIESADGLKALTGHEDFDLSNPNRVRSVAGVFTMQNLAAFHAPDGSGYRAIADLVVQADARNPALAARLLTAFEQWRSLEPDARGQAEQVLKGLADGDLSKNAMDIVSRALSTG
ncbi:MAG: aminopeptidase N [Hyphomonadaceae bacterium]|nr:aminopeptidase N [Hyphomonadaceae bacterium]